LGHVTSLSGMKDDTRFLQMSTPVQPGNSGGALVDMSGSVVGVVVAQLNANRQERSSECKLCDSTILRYEFFVSKRRAPKI